MDYNAIRQRIRGPIFSIITTFTREGKEVDHGATASYIRWLYSQGARIFYAMAFNTRYLLMTEEEIFRTNEVVIDTVRALNDPECFVIVGDPLNCSTETSIRFAKHAWERGADCISLIFRAYLFSDDQVYAHYRAVADACEIPLLVHEMPFMKGIPKHQDGKWSLELLNRLADIPNVVAMKEDAKEDDYTRRVVDLVSDRVAIVVSGNGLQQWSKVGDKCAAWLTGIGNFIPRSELDFYEAFQRSRTEDDDEQLKVCARIIDDIEKPYFWIKDNWGWHPGIKSTLDALGLMSRQERMPYQPLTDEQHARVVEILRGIAQRAPDYLVMPEIIGMPPTTRRLAVIPARGGSTRLPRKNVRLLAGKPLIRWMVETVVKTGLFETVVVSTDDDEIFDAVRDLPVTRHIRPAEHATVSATALNAMLDLMEHDVGIDGDPRPYDVFAYFLPTCPFLREEYIRQGVELLDESGADSVVSVSHYEEPIQLACIKRGDDLVPVFDNLTAGLTNSKFIQRYCKPNGGFYMGRWDSVLQYRNFFKGDVKCVLVPNDELVDIDYEHDLQMAELLYREVISKK
jgi:CMP-N-acetylneuraminic acid synthetase/dihydrodipicolinate synthase/N-acetylneuraminate lyase